MTPAMALPTRTAPAGCVAAPVLPTPTHTAFSARAMPVPILAAGTVPPSEIGPVDPVRPPGEPIQPPRPFEEPPVPPDPGPDLPPLPDDDPGRVPRREPFPDPVPVEPPPDLPENPPRA